MKRWQEDYRVAKREWKKHRRMHVEGNKGWRPDRIGVSAYVVDCECDEQIGRFRKRKAYGCGNPRCYICHYDKLMQIKTQTDKVADLSFKEQIRELD